ncbi:hypothetical protein FQA39_LY06998 [Lamprigera yunnana]|nr:hypothetical protein FQA39_LY06998 [Lamprigera yunnana]
MYAINFLILVLLSAIIQQSRCAFIDYDDIRDPFDFIWTSRDPLLSQPNKACYARLGSQLMEGVCMTDVHCALSKGQSRRNSTCGLLSNCCIYTGSCGDTTNSKVSYFVSNNNLPVGASCTNNVRIVNRNICQLKIDILSMTLESPDAVGLCSTERFEVPNTNVPVICGENSNQHLYAHLNLMNSRQIGLTITSQSPTKQFLIKVTQLYCPRMTDLFNLRKNLPAMIRDYPMLAPANCDQYYTAPSGRFKSIGYSDNSLIRSTYSRNLRYTICFKRPVQASECIG